MKKQRLKIAIVSSRLHITTGVGRYVVELAKGLAKQHDVCIFAHSWDEGLENDVSIIKVPTINKPEFLSSLIFTLFSLIKILFRRFDIIQGEITSTFKHDIITAHACFKYQYKLLSGELRGNVLKRCWHIMRPGNRYVLLMEGFHYRFHNYKKIIAVSPRVKRQLSEEYKVPDEDVCVIPNGINHNEFAPNHKFQIIRQRVREAHNMNRDEIVIILFIGHNFKRKGLDYLLKALVLLPNRIRLIVVGRGDKTCTIDMYKHLAKTLGVLDRVRFVGVSEVKDYYAACDIFVLPSLDEPFGLVVMEAMASGLPAIVSKSVGISEFLENKKECLIVEDCTNANELAKMIMLLSDLEYRNYLGTNGRVKIQEFSWDKVAEEVEKNAYAVIR